jgi:MYXO-CTERM domain-containing protein
MSEPRPLSRRPLIAALAALSLAAPSLASAAPKGKSKGGTVTVNTKPIVESPGGGWKVLLTIKLPRKPATPHQTFRFVFAPLVIYETYVDDSGPGEKTRAIPQGKDVQPNVETMDVGFSDARGDLYDTTKFDFTIRRDRGFFAGEYQLEVSDGEGDRVGQPLTLKLEGKNEVVDRRTMMLQGNVGPKKPPPGAASGAPAPAAPTGNEAAAPPLEGAVPRAEDMGPDGPPPVEKKGGCGCSVPGSADAPSTSPALLALAAVLGLARRPKRRRAPPAPPAG